MPETQRPIAALHHLLGLAGLHGDVSFTGADPVLPTRYRLGAAGAASLAAVGVAANALWALRHPAQQLSVDVVEAVASLRGHQYLLLDGAPPKHERDPFSGFYPTADGRHVFLHCNFPHLRDANIKALGVAADDRGTRSIDGSIFSPAGARSWKPRSMKAAASPASSARRRNGRRIRTTPPSPACR